jgi:type I restriction enzyme, S subunit
MVAAIEEQFSRLDAGSELLRASARRAVVVRRQVLLASLSLKASSQTVPLNQVLEASVAGVWGRAEGGGVDVSVFRVTEFREGGVLDPSTAARRWITPAQLARRALRAGDVLMEKSGGGPDRPVGRVVLVPDHVGPAVCSNFVQLLRADETKVIPRFLFRWLQRRYEDGSAAQFQRATTNIRNLQTQYYLRLPIPVPSLGEQRRIVAEVEARLSVIDSTQATIRAAQSRSAALRWLILDRAFRGQLVPQDPSDEPATVLIERIQANRAETERDAVQSTRAKRDAALSDRAR